MYGVKKQKVDLFTYSLRTGFIYHPTKSFFTRTNNFNANKFWFQVMQIRLVYMNVSALKTTCF